MVAKSADEDALGRNGKLAKDDAGPCRSIFCLIDGIRTGKPGKAGDGDVPLEASSLIDIVEAGDGRFVR